jgi:dTDP-4-dehydrorhamnose reductase
MRIAIIGANGQLGSDLTEILNAKDQVVPLTHDDIEISDIDRVKSVLADIHPDVVINTAAYHNVPQCEKDPIRAFEVNGLGPLNLSKLSNDLDYMLVHYSTDYVFDGTKHSPYHEEDRENPLNVYAVTKLAGEYFVRNYSEKHFVIRLSGIYGKVPCRAKGGNFITTMMRAAKEKPVVKVVSDEILTPTSTEDIAGNTSSLIRTQAYGLYHMSSEGECSWYEFAGAIFDLLNFKTPLEPCSVKDFPASVRRPHYSVMENRKLKKLGLNQMKHWKDSLKVFLDHYMLA